MRTLRRKFVAVFYQGLNWELVDCLFYPGAPATSEDPPESATLEYEKLTLKSDPLSQDLGPLLDDKVREQIEDIAVALMTEPEEPPRPE